MTTQTLKAAASNAAGLRTNASTKTATTAAAPAMKRRRAMIAFVFSALFLAYIDRISALTKQIGKGKASGTKSPEL